MAVVQVIGICLLLSLPSAFGAVVELAHGGSVLGKEIAYDATVADLFLGIPYAQAPIGDLRFKKPQDFPSWTGVRNATLATNLCPQLDTDGITVIGDEDCLALDIVVPGGVDIADSKPVMVWIHGGGYLTGSKYSYFGTPLAVQGDVIVVTINYRLGALGFLSEKFGTGNFGLWDQRAALLWVKENIAMFGGDPDLVTIFGESAGAASVSAQTMSPHNDGLFKRAILQSGALFSDWSWHISENQRYEFIQWTREENECPSDESVYDCFRDMTVEELFANVVTNNPAVSYWRPFPDDDFFALNITDETYELSKRFDLMAGFNGQEGLIAAARYIAGIPGFSTSTGASEPYVREILKSLCAGANPLSPELCVEYLVNKYELDTASDGQERMIRCSYLLGEFSFNVEANNLLSKHSSGDTSTYGYYFTQFYSIAEQVRLWPVPDWLRLSADHADEIFYVFGSVFSLQNNLLTAYYGAGAVTTPEGIWLATYLSGVTADDIVLANVMMTMWTNFARSGNPNQPVTLPIGTATWPQFDDSSDTYMELNSASLQVAATPEKMRLEAMYDIVFTARREQIAADEAPVEEVVCEDEDESDSSSRLVESAWLLATLVLMSFLL